MRLLDLFCCGGGASEGYRRAGFEVVGVDIEPQPNYPFTFYQGDAFDWLNDDLGAFDAVHASPPCQAYTRAQGIRGNVHPDLIGPVRELLQAAGLPYVIENVVGAPLIDPVSLDGTMFTGLRTLRERLFETNWPLTAPPVIQERRRHAKMGRPAQEGEWLTVVGNFTGAEAGRRAMGIHWLTRDELREAIPPAYTEWVGWELRDYINRKAV